MSELDAGFIRPSYPNQVQVSYMQAGLVCLFIEQRWGFERLVALLQQFDARRHDGRGDRGDVQDRRRRSSTRSSTRSCARASPAAREHERMASSSIRRARKAIESEHWADAVEPARRAVELYPEHTGPGSPNLLLARALDKTGRRAEAIAALRSLSQAPAAGIPTALRELARWLDEAGRSARRDRRC